LQNQNFINNKMQYSFMVEKKRVVSDRFASVLRETSFLGDALKLKMEKYLLTVNISHFIATISGVVLTVSLGKMTTSEFTTLPPIVKFGIVSIVAASLATIVVTLLTVEPVFKKDRDSNTFDYGTKLTELSRKDYIETIRKNLEKKENMISSYGHELHKLDMTILHRFKMIKSAIAMFLVGIILGGMLIIVSTFI